MRLAHKRKVQMKLQKRLKATVGAKLAVAAPKKAADKPAAAAVEKVAAPQAAAQAVTVSLTPKQQQVLDIVISNPDGINPKGIGLQAGQEDAKAASWATGALKKLVEEKLVEREQLAGNKVIYKSL